MQAPVRLNDDRKGRAWNLNPNYAASNWQVGYSYWNSKPDGGTAFPAVITIAGVTASLATANQESHRLYGHYEFGFGLKVGLAWDTSKLKADSSVGNGTISKRAAWSIPVPVLVHGQAPDHGPLHQGEV